MLSNNFIYDAGVFLSQADISRKQSIMDIKPHNSKKKKEKTH